MFDQLKYCLLTVLCIVLIGCSARQTPAPVASLSTSTKAVKNKSAISGKSYRVKSGETLYSIAFRANKDFRDIAKINNITKPYRIFPGQKIYLTQIKKKSSKASKYTKKPDLHTKNKQKNNIIVKKVLDQPKKAEYVQKQANKKSTIKKPSKTTKLAWRRPAKGKVIRWFSNKDNGYKGILVANKQGTAINAAADGIVVYAGSALKGYGKLIIVKHNDDYLSAYAHNKRLLVKEQQDVKVGQLIAEMGSSDAKVTGLRFEIRYQGKSVNPANYLPKH